MFPAATTNSSPFSVPNMNKSEKRNKTGAWYARLEQLRHDSAVSATLQWGIRNGRGKDTTQETNRFLQSPHTRNKQSSSSKAIG
jgi:hypothetical protein